MAGRAGCPRGCTRCSHEGTGHRRRRLHWIARSPRRSWPQGADVVGVDCFTDYYAADDQGAQSDGAAERAELSRSSKARCRRLMLGPLLDGVTHVFHLAAQAGVRKSWGDDFRTYIVHNVDATQRLLEASRAARFTDSCMPRARRSMAMRRRFRCARTRTCSRSRRTASPNWPPSTCATCTSRTTGCRPCPCASSPCTDLGNGRTWRSTASSAPAWPAQPITLYGDGEQTRDFTFVDRHRGGQPGGGRPGHARAPSITSAGAAGSPINQVLDIIGRLVGRPLDIHREETQKGDMRDTFADTSRARADLGFAPEWTLEAGLAAECDWLRLAGPAS